MIRSVKISHFKGYQDFQLDDLARVTLLGGRNNVGKTSLMEALFMPDDRANPGLLMRQFGWRGVPAVAHLPDSMWGPFFSGYSLERPIEIERVDDQGRSERLILAVEAQYRPPVQAFMFINGGQPAMSPEVAAEKALSVRFERQGQLVQSTHMLVNGFQYSDVMNQGPLEAFFLPSTQRVSPQEDAANFGRIELEGRRAEVVNFLRETVEPRLEDLTTIVVGNVPLIHAQIRGFTRRLPVAYMGEGMSRLLSMVLVIAANAGGRVFVDEIENGLHYSILPMMWRGLADAAARYDCQVFATTHSRECIQAAWEGIAEAQRAEFRYIRLQRSDEGLSKRVYDYGRLGLAVTQDLEVR